MYIHVNSLDDETIMALCGSRLKKRVRISDSDIYILTGIERDYKTRYMSILNAFFSMANEKGIQYTYSLKQYGTGEVKDKTTVDTTDYFVYEAYYATGLTPTNIAKTLRIFCQEYERYNRDTRDELFEYMKQRFFIDDYKLEEEGLNAK